MRLSMISDETKDLVDKQVDNFCERNASLLVRKSPYEIIHMWLDWQFSRYIVDEQPDAFYVNDLETKSIVACVTKKDPNAYKHAFQIRDDLNANEYEGSVQVVGHDGIDDFIRKIEKSNFVTLGDVIDEMKDGDDE